MAHLIGYIGEAYRLRTFNRALNLHERDLSAWPVDFVETVLIWAERIDRG